MALLDFLRQKEFAEISALKNKLALLEKDIEIFREREDRLNLDILSLRNERDKLLKYKDVSDVDNEKERIIKELKDAKEELQKEELESKDIQGNADCEITSRRASRTVANALIEHKKYIL